MRGPTAIVRRAVLVALGVLGAAGCTLLATLDEHATGASAADAGPDATTDAPGAALTLDIAFHQLTLPPKGAPFPVKLKVVRTGTTPSPVTVTVKGTANVSAPPVLLLANESEGSLAITVGDDPAVETARLEVTARSNDATSAPQELVVKIAGAPGTFDTTLGGTGILSPDVSTGDAIAFGMAVGADGTIVLAGSAPPPASPQPAFVALRLKPNGTPDPSFGTSGLVFLPFTATSMANAIALEPSGAVVLAGSTTPGPSLFVVARLLPDGRIDTSFGNGGSFAGGVDGGDVSLSGVVSFDGGVVATGAATLPDGNHVAFARMPSGALDVAPIGGGKERGTAIVQTRSGQLLTTGIRNTSGGPLESRSGLVMRASTDGGTDDSFGTKGTVAVPEAVLYAVAEEPGGSYVVGGGWFQTATTFKGTPTMLVRLLPNGGLDPSFGIGGRVVVDAGLEAIGVALQSDARIAAAGSIKTGLSLPQAALFRFTSSGALDPTFGAAGIVPLHPATIVSQATAIAIQPDGRIVVAGHVRQGTVERFFVARVWP